MDATSLPFSSTPTLLLRSGQPALSFGQFSIDYIHLSVHLLIQLSSKQFAPPQLIKQSMWLASDRFDNNQCAITMNSEIGFFLSTDRSNNDH